MNSQAQQYKYGSWAQLQQHTFEEWVSISWLKKVEKKRKQSKGMQVYISVKWANVVYVLLMQCDGVY